MVSKGSKQHVSLQAVEPARVEAPEGGLTRGPVPPAPQDCHPGSLPRQTKHNHISYTGTNYLQQTSYLEVVFIYVPFFTLLHSELIRPSVLLLC